MIRLHPIRLFCRILSYYGPRLLMLSGLCLLLAACQIWETAQPTATPVPTVPPTSTSAPPKAQPATTRQPDTDGTEPATGIGTQPLVATEPNADGTTTFVSATESFSLTLPSGWTVFPLTDDARTALLSAMPGESADAERAETAVISSTVALTAAEGSGLEAVATYAGEEGDATLTIATIARDGLSLQTYLRVVTAEFAEQENVTLEEAGFRTDLLASQLPAMEILAIQGDPLAADPATASDTSDAIAEPVVSYQVALFDGDAENIILLTFGAAQAQFDVLQPHFTALIQAVKIP